eukprot:Rhum_TRINITY_DN7741_c0_g2::Rhum_TRINITY_DN7741_c0_g2_i1::g.24325::m.24325
MFRGTRVACDGTKAASAKRLAGRNILQVPENRRRRGFQGDSPAERETRKAVFGHSSVNVVSGHYSSSYTMLLAQAQMRHWDGKPLPNAYRATTARAAPPPHEVFERLDGLGMVWTDRSVASLLEGVVVYVTTKYEQRVSKTKNAPTKRVVDAVYLREHAAPLVRHIHRWGNAAINNGTSRGLFYTLAIAGCDTRLVKALAREEPSDADAAASPAAEGLFRGRVRGFAMLRDTEGIDAVLAEMERRGVERSPALRAVLTAYYADEGLLDRLGAECGGSLEAVPTQSLRVVAASARDNFQPSLALAALCEMQARGEMDLTQDYTRRPGEEPGETLMQTVWGTFFQLRDEADIVKATALLRTWTVDVLEEGRRVAKRNNVTADLRRAPRGFPMPTLLDEVSPYAPYVAPFDALVLAACDAGRLDLALAVCNEAVFPTEPFAVLHPDACRRMLALAAEELVEKGGGDAAAARALLDACVAIVLHMHRSNRPPTFSTLLHIQSIIDLTGDTDGALFQGAVTEYCPNFDERLLYHLPGFRGFRQRRGVVGGPKGLRKLLSLLPAGGPVVIPHWTLFLTPPAAVDRAIRGGRGVAPPAVLLPFTTLSALQVTGDDMRLEGMKENPADAALHMLGSAADATPSLAVLGLIEQRVAAACGGVVSADVSEEGKLAALAGAVCAVEEGACVEVLCGTHDAAVSVKEALGRLAAAEGAVEGLLQRVVVMSPEEEAVQT